MGGADRSDKNLKKDQHIVRDTRDELDETIRSSAIKPKLENPNRDVARGDWDRTGDHHDEET